MITRTGMRIPRFSGRNGLVCVALGACLMAHDPVAAQGFDPESCTFDGIPLSGEVGIVERGGDISVEVVTAFPDLEVKPVESFPDDCGEWEFVENFPDFTINFVNSFPDLTIEFVESFPGVP